MSVLEVSDLSIRFGGLQALAELTLEVNEFEIVGLIGAALLLQTVIMNPGGLGQVIRPFARWFAGHKFTLHDPDGDGGVGAMEGSSVRA